MQRIKKSYQREPASVPTPSPGEVPASSIWLDDQHLENDHDKWKKIPDPEPSFPKKMEEKQVSSNP
jgi:hypothetical protein